ncbi:MAG: hypothetical protein QXI10_03485 [Candidatus Diapherotrites archaeon]
MIKERDPNKRRRKAKRNEVKKEIEEKYKALVARGYDRHSAKDLIRVEVTQHFLRKVKTDEQLAAIVSLRSLRRLLPQLPKKMSYSEIQEFMRILLREYVKSPEQRNPKYKKVIEEIIRKRIDTEWIFGNSPENILKSAREIAQNKSRLIGTKVEPREILLKMFHIV